MSCIADSDRPTVSVEHSELDVTPHSVNNRTMSSFNLRFNSQRAETQLVTRFHAASKTKRDFELNPTCVDILRFCRSVRVSAHEF